MRVFVIILIILAGVVWFVKRQYRATPEKAMKSLVSANSAGRLSVQPPVLIDRFEVADDFSVTAHVKQTSAAGFTDAETAALTDLAGKICNAIGKRVPQVVFIKGTQQHVVKP